MPTSVVGSGLATQLVAKDETTYGVAASLTSGYDSFEIQKETLELKKTAVVGEGFAAGRVYERTRRRVVTNYAVTGDISMDVPTRNLGYWLRYMIGDFTQTPAEIGSTGIYQTVFQPRSNMSNYSFTCQKGVATADNATVEPITYVGCKLSSWELSVATGGIAQMTLTVDGRNELAGTMDSDPLNSSLPPLALFNTPNTGLGLSVFHFREATLYSGGTPTATATTTAISGAPSLPASGTAVQNATGALAAVTISGGTVTSVTVNGNQVLSGDGTCFVQNTDVIVLTYTGSPTWTWYYATVANSSDTALGNVKSANIKQQFTYDTNRMFLGSSGFKATQIEDGYRKLTGSATIEWLSSEAIYDAFAADTTTSLELKFVGPTVSTSSYLLDIVIPNIKFEGESPKVAGPQVVTQAANWTAYDDEATVPIQVTYQSEDSSF